MKKIKKICSVCCLILLCSIALISFAAAENNILVVSLFSGLKEKALPSEWQIKEWAGKADVQIVNDGQGQGALRLNSNGTSTALYKDMSLNIKDSPFLNWRWKVTKIPAGGDVRKKETDDQAAQIYVIFPKFPAKVNSRMLGYIWDTSAPVGAEVTSTKFSKIKYIVLRSGANELGKWLSEKRNVYDDYKRLFGEEPPMVGKVSLMIDSDDTKTSAESFFGDIYFSME